MNEYTWFFTPERQNKSSGPSLLEPLRKMEVKVGKVVDKWDRAFLLDSKIFILTLVFRKRQNFLMGC